MGAQSSKVSPEAGGVGSQGGPGDGGDHHKKGPWWKRALGRRAKTKQEKKEKKKAKKGKGQGAREAEEEHPPRLPIPLIHRTPSGYWRAESPILEPAMLHGQQGPRGQQQQQRHEQLQQWEQQGGVMPSPEFEEPETPRPVADRPPTPFLLGALRAVAAEGVDVAAGAESPGKNKSGGSGASTSTSTSTSSRSKDNDRSGRDRQGTTSERRGQPEQGPDTPDGHDRLLAPLARRPNLQWARRLEPARFGAPAPAPVLEGQAEARTASRGTGAVSPVSFFSNGLDISQWTFGRYPLHHRDPVSEAATPAAYSTSLRSFGFVPFTPPSPSPSPEEQQPPRLPVVLEEEGEGEGEEEGGGMEEAEGRGREDDDDDSDDDKKRQDDDEDEDEDEDDIGSWRLPLQYQPARQSPPASRALPPRSPPPGRESPPPPSPPSSPQSRPPSPPPAPPPTPIPPDGRQGPDDHRPAPSASRPLSHPGAVEAGYEAGDEVGGQGSITAREESAQPSMPARSVAELVATLRQMLHADQDESEEGEEGEEGEAGAAGAAGAEEE